MTTPGTRPIPFSTWATSLVGSRSSGLPGDLAVLAVRAALAWIFAYYGTSKLFGSFNGPGIHRTAQFMAHTAHLHPGQLFAVLGGLIEFGGAVAMALGLATRLAGSALVGDMVMAMITVTWAHGINSEKVPAGYELNVALAVLALVVVLLGPGRFSIDAWIERQLASGRRRGNPSGAHGRTSDSRLFKEETDEPNQEGP